MNATQRWTGLALGGALAAMMAWFVWGLPWQARRGLVDSVRNELFDPGSAQVRALRYTDQRCVCGEINGKNRYGAYVGFKRFYACHYSRGIEPPEAFEDNQRTEESVEFERAYSKACI